MRTAASSAPKRGAGGRVPPPPPPPPRGVPPLLRAFFLLVFLSAAAFSFPSAPAAPLFVRSFAAGGRIVPSRRAAAVGSSRRLLLPPPKPAPFLPALFSAPRRLQSLEQDVEEEDEEEDDCAFPADAAQLRSPALVRGTAVGPSHREWNRRFVHGVKAAVFDALYPPATAAAPGEDGGGSSDAYYASFYARFYALETVARMPYFAYVSVLHLLETLGRWRRAEFLKLHFSEAWNELHHLLILEELLGNRVRWRDQFVAQHLAVFYYWAAVAIYLVNPALAYNVNQAVEEEASETYDSFLRQHRAYLQSRPAPGVARRYYSGDDLYLFDAMHHPSALRLQQPAPVGDAVDDGLRLRRPRCETLYDTFVNIRDDELEHVKTMAYLQGECQVEDDDQSQKQIRREADGAAAAAAAAVPVPVPFLKGGNHTAAAAAPPGALN